MLARLQQRMSREEGFTLIELLVVIVIIGILLAIAVPSYLGFKDRANNRAAQSNLRAAVPSAEAFYADSTTNSYSGLTYAAMKAIDSGLAKQKVGTGDGIEVVGTPAATYCLVSTKGNATFSLKGPGAEFHSSADCTGTAITP